MWPVVNTSYASGLYFGVMYSVIFEVSCRIFPSSTCYGDSSNSMKYCAISACFSLCLYAHKIPYCTSYFNLSSYLSSQFILRLHGVIWLIIHLFPVPYTDYIIFSFRCHITICLCQCCALHVLLTIYCIFPCRLPSWC